MTREGRRPRRPPQEQLDGRSVAATPAARPSRRAKPPPRRARAHRRARRPARRARARPRPHARDPGGAPPRARRRPVSATRPTVVVWRELLRDDPGPPRSVRAVALVLSTYANGHSGQAWPSRATLAAGAGYSVRTVIRAVAYLERAGYLDVERSPGRHTNKYRLSLPNGDTPATIAGAQRCQQRQPTVTPVSPEVEVRSREPRARARAPARARGSEPVERRRRASLR